MCENSLRELADAFTCTGESDAETSSSGCSTPPSTLSRCSSAWSSARSAPRPSPCPGSGTLWEQKQYNQISQGQLWCGLLGDSHWERCPSLCYKLYKNNINGEKFKFCITAQNKMDFLQEVTGKSLTRANSTNFMLGWRRRRFLTGLPRRRRMEF